MANKDKIKDLLNQLVIELRDEKTPEIDYDIDGGYSRISYFKGMYETDESFLLPSIKVVAEAMLKDLEVPESKYGSESQKMARAYYTSFCNA